MSETAHSPEPVANPPQILFLPAGDLEVPDWNPRKLMFEGPLKTLMAYIQAGGKVPRLLVWKGTGQAPWAIISGQRRWEAFKRLGHTHVEVEVMDIPLEQAKVLAMGSNEGEPVFWLDWDIRVEKLYDEGNQGGRKLTQAVLAAQLGVSQSRVSYALKTVAALTEAARALIYDTVIKSGDPDRVKERPIQILATLDDSQAVEKALPRVLEGQMAMPQVQRMVAGLKGETPASRAAKGPEAHNTPPLKEGDAKEELVSGGGPTRVAPAPGKASQALSAGLAGLAALATKASTKLGSTGNKQSKGANGGKGVWQEVSSFLLSEVKRALGYLIRKWIITGVAVLVVVLILSPHLYVNLWHLTPGPQAGSQALVVPSQSAAGNGGIQPGSVHLAFGYPGTHQSTAPQGGGQGLVVPSQGAEVNGDTKPGSVQAPIAEKPKAQNHPLASKPKGSNHPHLPAVSPSVNSGQALQKESNPSTASAKTIPAWSQGALPAAGDFANRFYGISYSNWNDTLNYLKAQMVGNGVQAMLDRYFPASLYQDLQRQSLVEYFSSKGAKVIGGEGDSAEVLVEGTVTTDSRAGRFSKTISTKPVALLMAFRHVEGFGNKIEKVTEVEPQTAANKAPNSDLIKQIGDGVKDVSNAASTVNNTASAVDQAKKVLGF